MYICLEKRVRNAKPVWISTYKKQKITDQYLTFFMGNEEYGVNVLCVPEICGLWLGGRYQNT